MAGGKLEVQIGADKTDFDKKIKEVEFDIKELSKVKLDRLKVGLDTTEINAQIKDAKNNLNQLKTTVKDTGEQIGGKFTKQVGNGGNTLTQFSRIAQDAPFGIIGIGNNITATAESFSYLKAQTGSTGGALKALASSIAGTGGILLGVSLLTTGLTLLAQSGLTVQDVINKLTGNFDEFGATVNKISVDSAKNSAQEIAGINALVSVAQDDVKSRKDRLLAVEELQSKYPAYFGNLNTERILNGDLTGVTKELTKAIIARAEATAIADKIGELASKKLDLEIQKEKALLKLQQAQTLEKNKVSVTGGTFGATGLSTEGRLATATATVLDLNKKILEVKIQQEKLAGRLNQKTSDSIKLLEKEVKVTKPKAVKAPKAPKKPKFDFKETFIPGGIVQPNINFDSVLLQMDILPDIVDENLKLAEARMLEFDKNINSIISDSIANTFSQLGTTIGESLVTGANILQAVGQTLVQSLGNLLSAIGNELIKLGTAAVLAGTVTKLFGTIAGIGAGFAAIAGGVALNAIGGGIAAGANRNVQKASTSSGSGANNQSFSGSSFSSPSGGGTVVFEIAGQKLIGVLNNTLNGNKRLGGAVGLG